MYKRYRSTSLYISTYVRFRISEGFAEFGGVCSSVLATFTVEDAWFTAVFDLFCGGV